MKSDNILQTVHSTYPTIPTDILNYRSSIEYWEWIQKQLRLPVTPTALNDLLRGGIYPELFYLFTLPRNFATPFLLMLAVNSYHCYVQQHHTAEGLEIYFMDTLNRFDPYFISEQARILGYNPMKVLSSIQLLRAFTWPSLVGACEEQLAALPPPLNMRVILGNYFFGDFEAMLQDPQTKFPRKIFQDVQKMVTALHSIRHPKTYVALTSPLHSQSLIKPTGGNLVAHLAGIHVRMTISERYHYFTLEQHPFLASRTIRIPISTLSPQNRSKRKKSNSRFIGGRNRRALPPGIHRRDPKGFHPKDKYLFYNKVKQTRTRGLDDFFIKKRKNERSRKNKQ